MKSKRIRRAVHSVHPEREKGDAPARLGRISKIRLWFLPMIRRKKRRKSRLSPEESAEHRRLINRWTIRIGALALVCLGAAIWKGLVLNSEEAVSEVAAPTMRDDSEVRVKSRFESLDEDEALALVKGAMEVRDPEKVGEFFQMGKSGPDEIIDYLLQMEAVDGAIDQLQWMGSMDANDMTLDGVVISYQTAVTESPRNRLALLVPDEEEKWRVDFAAFARVVDPSWDEVLSGTAKEAIIRVYIAEDTYFNGVFSDEEKWLSVSLGSPDTPELLIGYCKAGSPQASALRQISAREVPASRTVLEIRRVEGGGPRQVEITRVLAEDWVLGDEPFDRKFE